MNLYFRLKQLFDYPKYGCPYKRGDRYYFTKNTGLQNQNVLYTQETLSSEPRVFLDPNSLDSSGLVSLSFSSFSEDGKLCGYGYSTAGSDWVTIKVKDVETFQDFEDEIKFCKYTGISWTHDNLGFFYSVSFFCFLFCLIFNHF